MTINAQLKTNLSDSSTLQVLANTTHTLFTKTFHSIKSFSLSSFPLSTNLKRFHNNKHTQLINNFQQTPLNPSSPSHPSLWCLSSFRGLCGVRARFLHKPHFPEEKNWGPIPQKLFKLGAQCSYNREKSLKRFYWFSFWYICVCLGDFNKKRFYERVNEVK